MAGRTPLETRWGKIARTFSRNHNIHVRLTGMGCNTDMRSVINIPANSDDFKDADAQVLEGLVDHEWKHVEVQKKAEENGVETPIQLLERTTENQVKQLFNVYEDYRIERELAGELIGCAENLRVANEHLQKSAKAKAAMIDPFKAVGLGILGRLGGFNINWLPKEALEIVEALKPVWTKGRDLKDHVEAYELAEETWKALGEYKDALKEQQAQQEAQAPQAPQADSAEGESQGADGTGSAKGDDEAEGDDDGDGAGNDTGDDGNDEAEGAGNGKGDDEADGEGDDGDTDNDDDGIDGAAESNSGRPGFPEPTDRSAEEIVDFIDRAEKEETTPDLMDTIREKIEEQAEKLVKKNRSHVPHPAIAAQDTVKKGRLADPYEYNAIFTEVKGQVSALRAKLLSVLKSRTFKGAVRDQDQGSIDSGNLYRLRSGDKRIFMNPSEKVEIDVAVTLLMDLSGSMSGGKIAAARKAAIILAETMTQLNIPVEILGFNHLSPNRSKLSGDFYDNLDRVKRLYNRFKRANFFEFKTFGEPYKKAKNRIAAADADGHNCDGEALMWAAQRLAQRRESRKILIVLSDGRPNLGPGHDNTKLEGDLKAKVELIMGAGFEVIAVGILEGSVKHYYKDYIVINDAGELSKEIFGILKRKLIKRA